MNTGHGSDVNDMENEMKRSDNLIESIATATMASNLETKLCTHISVAYPFHAIVGVSCIWFDASNFKDKQTMIKKMTETSKSE